MNYQFELTILAVDVDLQVSDRHGHILPVNIQSRDNLTRLSTEICLPNNIIVTMQKNLPDGHAILKEVRLGNIRFNKNAIPDLFVYYHEYGHSRDTTWSYNGTANFSFFEFSAIKYHLLMKTRI